MKISVCMAIHNGEKYLFDQLRSILDQINMDDEIIIVNDASSDSSIQIIESFKDPRIKLFHNNYNLGVVKSFEKSLYLSSGNILFLSDQDDIWMPNKVTSILTIFHQDSSITLVSSDALVINGNGLVITDSFFEIRGKYTSHPILNLIKNKHHGCVLAFKKDILGWILPFPIEIPMHDIWIGIVNGIYGKSHYLNVPLIQYRRHGANASRDLSNHASLSTMIRWRYIMLKNIIILIMRRSLLRP